MLPLLLLHHSKQNSSRICCLLEQSCKATRISSSKRRTFAAVREVSWCSPSDSPNRKTTRAALFKNNQSNNDKNSNDASSLIPIDSFGIVAAMSKKNRVIGVSGRLPWNSEEMVQDRIAFVTLTRNKILIIGRKTLLEQQKSEQLQQQQATSNKADADSDADESITKDVLSHVSHAKTVIVLSKTVKDINNLVNVPVSPHDDKPSLILARSFPEALHLARKIVESVQLENSMNEANNAADDDKVDDDDDDIQCWVAGGEGIYNEALLHPSAKVIHLTVVDKDIVLVNTTNTTTASKNGNDSPENDNNNNNITRFPAKYRWDHKYRLHRQEEFNNNNNNNNNNVSFNDEQLPFTRFIYHRIKQGR